jgi:phosphatidylserine decarboxylase
MLLGWRWRVEMRTVIPGALAIGVLTWVVVDFAIAGPSGLGVPALVPAELFVIGSIALLVIGLRFYRDPERVPPETENVILSPADGRVIYVKQVEKGSSLVSTKGGRKFELKEIMATDSFAEAAYLIGIDMNVLNVHVNRAPIGGTIVLHKRVSGKFLSLRRPESAVQNERVTSIIDGGRFSVAVVQIASRLVRRIVSYRQVGDSVTIGQRIGMIKFGSQVDLAIPELEGLRVVINAGDEVRAGVSVVARYG